MTLAGLMACVYLLSSKFLLRKFEDLEHKETTRNLQRVSDELGARGDEDELDEFSFEGGTIDFVNLELRAKGTVTRLTVMEAELLRHLIRNRGRVVSRKSILEQVWGLREDTDTRAIDNFVVRLRRYLEENPSRPKHLLTVRGVGYRFESDADGESAEA